MDTLKTKIIEAPVFITLDFSRSTLSIILNIDASTTVEWRAMLSQQQEDG